MDTIENFFATIQQMNAVTLLLFGLFFLMVWFLPSLLALLLNRQHAGKIALLNIPAGFSWIVWLALCVWAVTGKLGDKLAAKARLKPLA